MSNQTTNAMSSGGINRATLIPLVVVVIAGALGGLLFFVVAKWTGTPLPTVFGSGTASVLMFVGSLAAVFGVYLLTASDPKAIRTYVFAVACGLAWQPMINSAKTIATNAAASNQTAQVGDKVAQVKAATNGGNVQQINTAVEGAASVVNNALNFSTSVTDVSKKAEIADTSKLAINELQYSAVKAPDASVDALRNISLTAANSGEPSVALHAIEALHAIGNNAMRNADQSMTEKVQQSLAAVAAQAKDVSVQTAARTPVSQSSQ